MSEEDYTDGGFTDEAPTTEEANGSDSVVTAGVDADGNTSLHLAVIAGDLNAISTALQTQADVNQLNNVRSRLLDLFLHWVPILSGFCFVFAPLSSLPP
jgi:hypothetical protein